MPEMQVLEKHEERRYTLGVVYEPNVEDTDGEFAKAEDIESAAWLRLTPVRGVPRADATKLPLKLEQSHTEQQSHHHRRNCCSKDGRLYIGKDGGKATIDATCKLL